MKESFVNPLLLVVIIIWAISALALIALVLLHSGKGTGLSETFGGGFQSTVGTGIIEKNLDRITVVAGIVFVVCLLIMMLIWPTV
jgi:preprotein translocase subunit SecG